MRDADVVIQNGRLVSVSTREIVPWDVAIAGGRIACIARTCRAPSGLMHA
jgi:adenine deaminase